MSAHHLQQGARRRERKEASVPGGATPVRAGGGHWLRVPPALPEAAQPTLLPQVTLVAGR
jgi:hypothetical protein